jgi:hypothetical protein
MIASASEDIGRQNKALVDRWRCTDERCINEQKKGWCFVDWGAKHYNMDHTHMHTWAKHLQQGEPFVSIERPPAHLYKL